MQVKKILIVDDSATIRHYMVDTLIKLGFEVVTAENGDEAIAKSKAELPDLILMDVVMPEMNGFQATRAISRDAATKHIPVMLLTSKDQATDRIWGLRQGAREYLTKPISREELLARINALEKTESLST
jgi:twitching motility two-component system response regulator PilH